MNLIPTLTRALLALFISYLGLMHELSFEESDLGSMNFENNSTIGHYLPRSDLFGKYLYNFEGIQSQT